MLHRDWRNNPAVTQTTKTQNAETWLWLDALAQYRWLYVRSEREENGEAERKVGKM